MTEMLHINSDNHKLIIDIDIDIEISNFRSQISVKYEKLGDCYI